MTGLLEIVLPVFAIIVVGYAAARSGYLSQAASVGIADFAFLISIPALLFRTILLARFDGVAPAGILASFFGAAAVVWLLSALATGTLLNRPAADAPSIAMCAVFGNTIMLGLPIGVAAFGPESLAPFSVILAIHAPVFLAMAALHMALFAGPAGEPVGHALIAVARQIATQPFIVAIAAATVWRLSGLGIPAPALTAIDMLAKAGVPAALVALGLSLHTFEFKGNAATLSLVLFLKLAVMPAVAAVLAVYVFALPRLSAEVVVLMAALPAGANAYLYAVRSGRVINSASGAVALGTALSALTLSALIAVARALP